MNPLLPIALLAGLGLGANAILPTAQEPVEKEQEKKKDEKTKPFEVGTTIPEDYAFVDMDGKTHSMKEYRDKVVFLHFYSMSCPYMVLGEPKIQAIADKYAKDKKDVVVIGINSNQRELGPEPKKGEAGFEKLREYIKENKVTFPIMIDRGNKVSERFQGKTTPHCFVIDQKGVLRYEGALDDDPRGKKKEKATDYVSTTIDKLLAGEKIEVSATKPYG